MIPVEPDTVDLFAVSTYREQLYPWCIIRALPNMQRMVVQRFRKRAEAEEYFKVLKRLMPDTPHQIVFDRA